MVKKKKSEDECMIAQMLFLSARLHYRGAESCNKSRLNYQGIEQLLHTAICIELILHSIELSLKLSLLLEGISPIPTHDIFKLYEKVANGGKNQLNLQSKIVNTFNNSAEANKFSKSTGIEIVTCIKKHRLTYENLRYLFVEKNFQSVPSWEISHDDVRILWFLSMSLLIINEELMGNHGISVLPPELPKTGAKDSKISFQLGSK